MEQTKYKLDDKEFYITYINKELCNERFDDNETIGKYLDDKNKIKEFINNNISSFYDGLTIKELFEKLNLTSPNKRISKILSVKLIKNKDVNVVRNNTSKTSKNHPQVIPLKYILPIESVDDIKNILLDIYSAILADKNYIKFNLDNQ